MNLIWIITLAVTTIVSICGWVISLIRDIKKTATELQAVVSATQARVCVLESQYTAIHADLGEIKRLLLNRTERD